MKAELPGHHFFKAGELARTDLLTVVSPADRVLHFGSFYTPFCAILLLGHLKLLRMTAQLSDCLHLGKLDDWTTKESGSDKNAKANLVTFQRDPLADGFRNISAFYFG